MILKSLKDDYRRQKIKPSQLLISLETYYEILKGERAMQSCYRLDRNGRLETTIVGCSVYVVNFLDSSHKWLV